nr:MAG TPA: hypothetical protein [Caudoviricetes sp.]
MTGLFTWVDTLFPLLQIYKINKGKSSDSLYFSQLLLMYFD